MRQIAPSSTPMARRRLFSDRPRISLLLCGILPLFLTINLAQLRTSQSGAKQMAEGRLTRSAPYGTKTGFRSNSPRQRGTFIRNASQQNGQLAQFLDTAEYPVGDQPGSIATGDFNGDGKPDLVVVNTGYINNNTPDNTVSVLLGVGDSTFASGVTYGTALLPSAVAVGDFNDDGKLDLAVAGCGGTGAFCGSADSVVSILLGNGDGTFQTHVDYTVQPNSYPIYGPGPIVVDDLNGDGKLDLVIGAGERCCATTISVLLGNGDGTFQPVKTYPAGQSPNWIALGDFNGDGKPDVAVVDNDHEGDPAFVNILLGNGDGTFQAFVSYPSCFDIGVGVADLNGDGAADLILTCALSGSVEIHLGNGDGTFQSPMLYGTVDASAAPFVGDFNGDGKLDVAFVEAAGDDVGLLMGNGDGTFGVSMFVAAGGGPADLVAADFDGDGKLDLVTADANDNTVGVLLNKGNGNFQTRGLYGILGVGESVTSGDFNNDGKADLAVATPCGADPNCASSGSVNIFEGNGDGTFNAAKTYPTAISADSIAVGDFNGDGNLDVVTASYSSTSLLAGGGTTLLTMSILLGNGDGTLQTHQDYPGGGGPDNSGYSDGAALAVADLNGDGKLDVIATAPGIGAVVWLGNGDGTFQPKVTHGTGSDTLGLALEDFNGDGRLDMVVGNGAGVISWDNRYGYPIGVCRGTTVSVLMGNGDGTFGQPIAYPAGFYPSIGAVGDFRGDGKLDLAVNSEAADSTCARAPNPISVLSSNGDGTFQAPKVISVNLPEYSLAVGAGDFNLDGKLDLLTFSNDLSLLLGNGDGTFQSPMSYPAGSNVTSVWIGDVNRDGEPDVVTTDSPYLGEPAPASANSANVLLNLQGPDFSITAGAIKNLNSGESASAPVKVQSFAGLTGSVALSCSVSPATSNAPTCSLAPASVQLPANGSVTSTLTINVPGAASALSPHLFRQDFFHGSFAGFTVTGLSFGIVLLSSRSRKSKLLVLLCTTALVAVMVCLSACGGSGGGSGNSGGGTTPSGTYTITVTGMAGSIVNSMVVTLMVQ